MSEKKEITIENLAGMVKRGFDELGAKIDGVSGKMINFQEENRRDHESFKKDFADVRFRLSELVHKSEFYELQERVEKLEAKLASFEQTP